ncbi:phenylalanine--tRNA ligase subunit alpha [Roseospira visakhapatnamensis]|uniref:Phenylalanine--tRNA ligase alpha subunit n=1 Tax=Roseospira visakhapatnamensis TaxID=390880 RepID=A0A7W6RDD3_9PROT|nr:phenylalanine--tRNA ligase subunit alpha [Roseospira visakhapatnamensis]MBB4266423.1 phenylalanyl-tRNA synthetase alpha chain [Roseospira visakhapatnamensis]
MEDLETLRAEVVAAIAAAPDLAALEETRVAALGKKGRVTALMKSLGGMDPETRKAAGQQMNRVKDAIVQTIEGRRAALEAAELEARLGRERVDVTLPARPARSGAVHPISQTWDEVVAIFGQMGFAVAEGPDIEDDFHNFTALNFPPGHPAREMHDTFFLPERADGTRHVLRTHTSPVQVRTMLNQAPPIRILAPGRTYRSDSDMTHTPMFHQFEGLVLDQTTHMGHLKGCLQEFVQAYFEVDDVPMRFRPSFFPFTEPSAEVDIRCSRKGGELRIGVGDDWLEILGCGMVHPNVLRACGLDPEEVQGFAFGVGLERIAMLKYGIPDLRTFFDSDLRWLRHYGFAALDVPTLHGGLAR